MKTEVLLDHEPVADGGWVVRALLKIEGDATPVEGRIPLNLALVLDRSGSMSGEPIERAREAARLAARRLWPEDTVSVVAFGSRVETVVERHTGADRTQVLRRIGAIEIEGCTNLSGGWLKGRDHVAHAFKSAQVNRILLLTDGLANEGITDPGQLTALCRAAAEQGVTTTTIGFGIGYNEHLLAAMAEAGHGHTYYIETPDQAPSVFEEEIEGLLTLAAQNVAVRLQAAPDVQFVAVHHASPSQVEGEALAVELGDLYAREPKLMLAEFLIPPAEEGATVEVARFVVSGYVLTAGGGIELRTVTLPITLSPTGEGRVEPEVRREWLVLEAARARREALERRAQGDDEGASTVLREAGTYLTLQGLPDAELAEEASDLLTLSEQIAMYGTSAADAKYLHQRAYDKMRGRKSSTARISRTRAPDAGEDTATFAPPAADPPANDEQR
jgi:Ca-activated chloride channel family protein